LDFKFESRSKKEMVDIFSLLKNEDLTSLKKRNSMNLPIFTNDENIMNIANEGMIRNVYSNHLHPDVFYGSRYMNSQLIKIFLELFKGNTESCGHSTSGTSESNVLAMFGYKNLAFKKKGICHPEMIIPVTAHPSFDKAADVLGIKMIRIPLNYNFQADINLIKKAVNKNTMVIIASYPNNINGIIDDIETIASIALKNNIPFHVDCSLGGVLFPFFAKESFNKCDFSIKGITSINIELHKYGLSPYGSAVLLYISKFYRKNNYYFYNAWSGGIYPTPGFPGSRTLAPNVASLTLFLYLGKNYFIDQAKAIYNKLEEIKEFVRNNCKYLIIIGDPKLCLLAIAGKNIIHIYKELNKRNWELVLIYDPIAIQFMIKPSNLHLIGNFLKDLKEVYDITVNNKTLIDENYLSKINKDNYMEYVLDLIKN